MIKENNVFLSIISRFEFWKLRLFLFLINKARMDVDTHFFSKCLIIKIEMLFWIDKSFEFVQKIAQEMVSLIEDFLRILSVLPIRCWLHNGDNLFIRKKVHFFSYFLGGIFMEFIITFSIPI